MSEEDNKLSILIEILTKEVGSQRAKEILDEAKAATDKNTEATDKLGLSHRSLHGILHLIGSQAGPAAGAAVAGATALMTGGMFAAIYAVKELFEWFQRMREKAEEFREQQANLWLAAQQGAQDATKDAHDFAEKMNEAGTKSDSLSKTYAHQITLLNDQIRAHKELLEALEKEALAAAKGDKDAEEAVRKKFARLKAQYNLQATAMLIGKEQGQIAGLETDAGYQAETATGFESQRQGVLKTLPALQAAVKAFGDPAKLKAAADEAWRLEKEADKFGNAPDTQIVMTAVGPQTVPSAASYARAAARAAAGDINNFGAYLAAADQLSFAQSQLDTFTRGRDKAVAAFGADESKIGALKDSIDELNITMRELQKERLLGVSDRNTGQTLGQLLTETNKNPGQIEAILQAVLDRQLDLRRLFEQLESQVRYHK